MKTEGISVNFIGRLPGIAGDLDKDRVLAEAREAHEQALISLGFDWKNFWRAEQVHGGEVAVVPDGGVARLVEGVDGLVTHQPGIALGIYVADCGLIWLRDPKTGAIGLLHSGKKGTEANILARAVHTMQREYGTDPADLIGVLGPCIRPPHYEIDFAATIRAQAAEAGIGHFEDSGLCTASDLTNYYSYRLEKGRTGRMLGLIAKSARRPRTQPRWG